jgi:hypothetical protein
MDQDHIFEGAADLRAHVFTASIRARRNGFRYEITFTDGPAMTLDRQLASFVMETKRGCRKLAAQFGATPHNF